MSLVKYLKEELQSPKIMCGRTNCYFDSAKGSYQVFYKGKDGITYQFTAVSENETYDDTVWKLSFSYKIQGNTETIPEEEVENFTEAVVNWVNNFNPVSFYFIKSEKYPAYNKIAEKLSKKLKNYNFIDESKQTHDDQKYDVIEELPELQYKRFIFTRNKIKDELKPDDWFEKKMDDFSKIANYEPVKDIKPNKEHITPFAKSDKLDKNFKYEKLSQESNNTSIFLKYIKENLVEYHPAYEDPKVILLTIPEKFICIQLLDADSETIIENEYFPDYERKIEYNTYRGYESSTEYRIFIKELEKYINESISKIIDFINKNKDDENFINKYKKPWFITIFDCQKNDINGYEIDFSKPINENEIIKFFENIAIEELDKFINNPPKKYEKVL